MSPSKSLRIVPEIYGDDVEQHRRQLETHPIINDITPPMSDVEYPRHDSAHFDDDYSLDGSHPWSFLTGDELNGLTPYTGATISTAAHHASALSLSAGLAGGRTHRRRSSLSLAEYDPERSVRDLIAGANSGQSFFDLDVSKSQRSVRASFDDPVIVESTIELDRILQSGHVQPVPRSRSPSISESDSVAPSHSKLSHALSNVGFSPRRRREGSPRSPNLRLALQDDATPRPTRSKNQIFPQYGPQRTVQVQPRTPSTTASKFTQAARGLAKEIQAETERVVDTEKSPRERSGLRQPVHQSDRRRQSVVLPDVTGLTSAVESPAKGDLMKMAYGQGESTRQGEAHILATLAAVQSKLQHLESENAVSRRRVRELEMELEACKDDVQRERTRVLDREDVIAMQRADASPRRRGKTRDAREVSVEMKRYREVVEEKKALEALIASLRSHLKRLSSELGSHKALLTELRRLRDTDVQKLRAKDVEVENLRKEVERLAGEVEVLKGIVEEGLKERREARESLEQSRLGESVREDDEADEGYHVGGELSQFRQLEDESGANDTEEQQQSYISVARVEEPLPFENGRSQPSDSRLNTEHTAPRSPVPATRQLLDGADFKRISKELDERRSSDSKSPSLASSRMRAASNRPGEARPATPTSTSDIVRESLPKQPRVRIPHPNVSIHDGLSHGRKSPVAASSSAVPTVPFPQIRGKRLETLFFAAPEHDAETCKVCHRKRRSGTTDLLGRTPSLPSKKHDNRASHVAFAEDQDDEDEGFVEGSECSSEAKLPPNSKGKQQERNEAPQEDELEGAAKLSRQPPQTVLAHVLREIEDDFTHYKAVYVELADQYKLMDAISNVPKRNILAQHLKEVVDILEQKGNQIASLYDLLTFSDKPLAQ